MNLRSATIAGANAAVALSTGTPVPSGYTAGNQLYARVVILSSPSGNAHPILIGGSEVTSTVGYSLAAGQVLTLPSDGTDPTSYYDLSAIKAYIQTGDTLYVLAG